MAEGIMKKFYGTGCYVQSVGVKNDMEIDGFSIAVCQEIGVELSRHRARSFDEMEDWGDDLSGFDLVVALSPASQRRALELTRFYHLEVEYWPIMDPTGFGDTPRGEAGELPAHARPDLRPDDRAVRAARDPDA